MANEVRLIRYEDVYRHAFEGVHGGNLEDEDFNAIVNAIDTVPAVDAVEVVRCANCQYWNPRYETMGMCMKHNSIVTFTKPDFYCAWGKGKNDGICKED